MNKPQRSVAPKWEVKEESDIDSEGGDSFDEDDDDPDKIEVPGGGKTLEAALQMKSEPNVSKVGGGGAQMRNDHVNFKLDPTPSSSLYQPILNQPLKNRNGSIPASTSFQNPNYIHPTTSSHNSLMGINTDFLTKFLSNPNSFNQMCAQLLGNPNSSSLSLGRGFPNYPQSMYSHQQHIPSGKPYAYQQMQRPHQEEGEEEDHEEENLGVVETFAEYKPSKLKMGKRHPDPVIETASLASVLPPDVTYKLNLPKSISEKGALSALQLEAVVYASQHHQHILPNGERAGFLIGDGAGVGKGRSIAGIIYENWIRGRKRSIWVSVSSDLKYDAERDLSDIGASGIKVYPLNKLKYAKIDSAVNGNITEGVIYSTYSSLIGETSTPGKYKTRLKMLKDWFGLDYDGCIVFDECHRAKNLVPVLGSKPTKTGRTVEEIQKDLKNARIVYASATGASEPKNMAYMTRLGIWGPRTRFNVFGDFHSSVEKRGVGAMEIVAMDMKLRGAYMARQLSFTGVTFSIEEVPIEPEFIEMYDEAVGLWVEALIKFQEALGLMCSGKRGRKVVWSQFWSAHQRFFKYLCIAAKVPHAVNIAREAVKNGKCVVIGLQSTGEARTLDQLEKDEELESFVSTAKGVIQSLVEKHFPCPEQKRLNELKELKASDMFSALLKEAQPGPSSSSKRKPVRKAAQKAKNKRIRYNGSDSESGNQDSDSDFEYNDDSESSGSINSNGKVPEIEEEDPEEFITDSDSEDDLQYKGKKGGRKKTNQMADESGPSPSKEAKEIVVGMRDKLLEKIEKLGSKLPANTLDQLIDDLGGPGEVAEMTGRKGRLISTEEGAIYYESRSESEISLEAINMQEKKRFMDGKKKIAIISEAASSGISLQSDRRVKNQLRRVHITLELPWSADRAIQQFGRTHRSNQVNAPEYIFTISELAGEQRFASIVAKRLESLGALTHGDRRATESRDLSRFNIDTKYGRQALETILRCILGHEREIVKPPGGDPMKFYQEAAQAFVGVGLFVNVDGSIQLDKDINISKFLNRLLGTPVRLQNSIFQFFTDTLTEIISKARKTGRFDLGILDIGDSESGEIKILGVKEFKRKHATGVSVINIHSLSAERGMCWSEALAKSELLPGANEGFYLSKQVRNGKRTPIIAIEESAGSSTSSDKKKSDRKTIFTIYRPNTGMQIKRETLGELLSKNEKCTSEEAQPHWDAMYEAMKDSCIHAFWNGKCKNKNIGLDCDYGTRTRIYHVLNGAVLTVWTDVESILGESSRSLASGKSRMQVVRVRVPGAGKIIGVLIPNKRILDELIEFFENSPDPLDDPQ